MIKNKFYIVWLLLVSTVIFGQQKRVETFADSTKIKIGSRFHLILKTTVDTTSHVVFPEGPNFGQLEVLESYPVDTVKKKGQYDLVKRYGLTQFDSGRYTIPRVAVFIDDKPFLTDSLFVEVNTVVVDTLKQGLYDIKPIIEVPPVRKSITHYILLGLFAIGLGILIYWLIKKYNKKQKEEKIIFATPIEKASSSLKNLEQKELWQKGEVKHYYSELTNIVRNYIEEAMELPAMESTTNELIIGFRSAIIKKKMSLSQETLENLERVLKNADLVKFAKSRPLDFEIAEDRNRIEKVITVIDKAIPEPTPEELALDVFKKELLLKEKRKKRIQIAGVIALLVVFLGLGYFISKEGWSNLKDSVFGNSTKELLEGEWVSSDYGDPAVFIETPRVLKRYKNYDQEQYDNNEKENQRFLYGSLLDNFYITVITEHFPKPKEGEEQRTVSLEEAMDEKIKAFETQYTAKNILVKQENYDTKQGITGKKAYGTMTIFDPAKKKERKMGYQILIFLQENGLQQIIMTYRAEDQYAVKISERILNSVELKKTNE